MASITTRVGKGSPLTTQELDANFTNLNADKLEKLLTGYNTANTLNGTEQLAVVQDGDVKKVSLTNLLAGVRGVNTIGSAGSAGFGVGVCPSPPSGFVGMPGFDSPLSDNYGNYQYLDGSVMCWIPAFFYRIAPDTNDVSILPRSAYADVATANAAGYALHRAFYDGVEQPGFFIDKYLWSAVSYGGNTIAGSVKNGNPLSSNSAHNPWGSLTGLSSGDNICAGAIPAAKTRGANFFCASQFQRAALALLSLAHAQAATATTYCAWWVASGVSAPRGCNSNALGDVNDGAVKWQADGYLTAGKTGSAGYGGGAGNVFAKSTHNGQNCGVADLNGTLWEMSLGITCVATAKAISGATQTNPVALTITGHGFTTGEVVQIASVGGMTQINDKLFAVTVIDANTVTLDGCDGTTFGAYTSGGTATVGRFYAAAPTTRMRDFTAGASLATDHWGATGVAAMMASIPAINFLRTDYPQNGFNKRFGRGANQVLSAAVSGSGWTLTGLGLPLPAGISDGTSGSNAFGADNFYQTVRDQACLLAGGYWANTAAAGVWAVVLSLSRTDSDPYRGGRAGLYL